MKQIEYMDLIYFYKKEYKKLKWYQLNLKSLLKEKINLLNTLLYIEVDRINISESKKNKK